MGRKWAAVALIIAAVIGCSGISDEELIKDLKSDTPSVRLAAMRRLTTKKKDPERIRKIINLLDHDDELMRFLAVQLLGTGNMTDSMSVKPLAGMLDSPKTFMREHVAYSLGNIGHDSAIPPLVSALDDSISSVRYAAVRSLGYMHSTKVLSYVYPMFRDPVDSVRVAAIQALYNYRSLQGADIRAADFAVPVSDENDRVRYVAVQALGGTYPDSVVAVDILIQALDDDNKYVRLEAIKSLQKHRAERAVPLLKQMYDTATIEEEASISEAIKAITGKDYPTGKVDG